METNLVGSPREKKVPAVLTIAGFDPASGAGVTADLKVFAAHRLDGLACVTALTVQSTQGVRRVEPVNPELVTETLACLEQDIAIAGVKIGMLATTGMVSAVAAWLRGLAARAPGVPVVVDPVLRASSGRALLDPQALSAFTRELLPLATVATPNLGEAKLLAGSGTPPGESTREAALLAGRALQRLLAPGRIAVVVTGGHLAPPSGPDDLLLASSEADPRWFAGEWIDTRATHGTGCAFSSALLCGLVQGLPLGEATAAAKRYVRGAMLAAHPVGQGRGPMHHLFLLEREAERAPGAPGSQRKEGGSEMSRQPSE